MKFTLPNIISLLRVVLSPVFFVLILQNNADYIFASIIVYHIAAITDFFDGWLARKFKSVSEWGNFFDPLADKVLTSSAFIAFVVLGIANIWLVSIIIIRDFFTTYLRVVADSIKKPIKTSWSAKVKTSIQMIYISSILILYMLEFTFNIHWLSYLINLEIANISLLLLAGITVWTAVEYSIQNKEIFTYIFKKKVTGDLAK